MCLCVCNTYYVVVGLLSPPSRQELFLLLLLLNRPRVCVSTSSSSSSVLTHTTQQMAKKKGILASVCSFSHTSQSGIVCSCIVIQYCLPGLPTLVCRCDVNVNSLSHSLFRLGRLRCAQADMGRLAFHSCNAGQSTLTHSLSLFLSFSYFPGTAFELNGAQINGRGRHVCVCVFVCAGQCEWLYLIQ